MAKWLKGIFQGQTTTHVANAFHEDIWVRCDADTAFVKQLDLKIKAEQVEVGVGVKFDWHFAERNGFTRIGPHMYLGFTPNTSNGTVYITVISDSGRSIAHCFPQPEDYSIIIDASGYIERTKYGEIWVDRRGNRH